MYRRNLDRLFVINHSNTESVNLRCSSLGNDNGLNDFFLNLVNHCVCEDIFNDGCLNCRNFNRSFVCNGGHADRSRLRFLGLGNDNRFNDCFLNLVNHCTGSSILNDGCMNRRNLHRLFVINHSDTESVNLGCSSLGNDNRFNDFFLNLVNHCAGSSILNDSCMYCRNLNGSFLTSNSVTDGRGLGSLCLCDHNRLVGRSLNLVNHCAGSSILNDGRMYCRNLNGLFVTNHSNSKRIKLGCNGSHDGLCRSRCLLLIHKNGGSKLILINRCADMYYTANLIGGNDGDGNILCNICSEGLSLRKYGFFPSDGLGSNGLVNESASLNVVLVNMNITGNVAMGHIVILSLGGNHAKRLYLGSISSVNRLGSIGINEGGILKGCGENILVNRIRLRKTNLVCIRISSAVDRLDRIGITLGDDNTVEAVNLFHGLSIKKECRSRLECIEEHRVGCIPLGIVKILIELRGSVIHTPFMHISLSSYLEIYHNCSGAHCEEDRHASDEEEEHGIVKSARCCCLSFCEGRYCHS